MSTYKFGTIPESIRECRSSGDSLGELRTRLYEDHYNTLESTVLSIMAAGVSFSSIKLSAPELVIKDNIATLNSTIKFK